MIRRFAVVLACIGLALGAITLTAGAASAQSEEPTIEQFTDAEGNVDTDGYVAALNAYLASSQGGSALPATGSNQGELVAVGAGLILVGGTMVLWVRDRRRRSAA